MSLSYTLNIFYNIFYCFFDDFEQENIFWDIKQHYARYFYNTTYV